MIESHFVVAVDDATQFLSVLIVECEIPPVAIVRSGLMRNEEEEGRRLSMSEYRKADDSDSVEVMENSFASEPAESKWIL